MYRASAGSFLKAIRRGKASQGANGWMVDLHTKKEYKGMKCFLTPDGKTGVAIKRNGDVVSVFTTSGKRNSMAKIIPFAVANGGRKLDCYAFTSGKSLHNMYGRFGAKAHGKMEFDPQYNPVFQRTARLNPGTRRPTHVVAMSLPSSLGAVIRAYNGERKIDLGKVKSYDDYDKMMGHRDAAIALRDKQNGIRGALGGGK